MTKPVASVEIRAESARLAADLARASDRFKKFGDGVKGSLAKGGRGGGGSIAGGVLLGNLASGVVSRASSFLEDGAKSAYNFEDKITRLAIAADKAPEAMDAYRNAVKGAAKDTGLDVDVIGPAADAYVKLTGDLDTATAALGTFSRVAQGSDSNIQDISLTGAQLGQTMGITADQMEEAFSALIVQGKAGAVELKDMAGELSGIAPQFAQFAGGKGLYGLRQMGATLQIVRRGFSDASEAATGMRDLMTAMLKHSDRLAGVGVHVFADDRKTLRNMKTIVDDIAKKGLSEAQLVKVFGTQEAYRAFTQLKENGELYGQLVAKGYDAGAVQRDLNTYLASSAGRVALSWEKVKLAVLEAFTPDRIAKFASAVEHVVDLGFKLVDAFGEFEGKLEGIGKTIGRAFGWRSPEQHVQDVNSDRSMRRIWQTMGFSTDEIDKVKGMSMVDQMAEMRGRARPGMMSEADATAQVAREDLLANQLRAGKRAGVNANAVGTAGFRTVDQGYSLAELAKLSKVVKGGPLAFQRGTSNSEELLRYAIPAAVAAEIRRQTGGVQGRIGTVIVQIGNDQIAKAQESAPRHRGKPHGG